MWQFASVTRSLGTNAKGLFLFVFLVLPFKNQLRSLVFDFSYYFNILLPMRVVVADDTLFYFLACRR